ncbi:hypothetical protein BHE74_00017858 [Ensete ventricosum]|nr:hypothetical protein GW17_00056514 [Ensete ventricosum]RWW74224.1 hypothetical protein BHE74_00017858 [Ensete ventricosum]
MQSDPTVISLRPGGGGGGGGNRGSRLPAPRLDSASLGSASLGSSDIPVLRPHGGAGAAFSLQVRGEFFS